MKKTILAIFTLVLIGCTNVLDKPLSKENLMDIKEIILSDDTRTPIKNKFIWDNLSKKVGYLEMGQAMGMGKEKPSTFRDKIKELSISYDSIKKAKEEIRKNNDKIKAFCTLTDSEVVGISKYKGYLYMTFDFDNQFDKEVLYFIMNYKYEDKYDNKYFDEKAKISDKITNNFKNGSVISLSEQYNDVAKFIYTKVQMDRMKEYLMEGLQIEVLKIVFTDKSSVEKKNGNWKYFDK